MHSLTANNTNAVAVPANAAEAANAVPSINLGTLNAPAAVKVAVEQKPEVEYTSALSLEGATTEDTAIIAKSKDEYVVAFKSSAEKTARATLEMCRVVYEASRSLDGFQFGRFCKDIGFNDYSSTIRKYISIGKLYPRFIAYADQLPSSWTNIYLITQIPAEHFEEMVKAGQSLASLKGQRLANLLKETSDVKRVDAKLTYDKKNIGYVFGKMMFTKTPDDTDVRAIQKALNEVSARLPVKFVIAQALQDVIEKRKEQRDTDSKRFYKRGELRPDMWDLGVEANAVYQTPDEVKEASEQRFEEAA